MNPEDCDEKELQPLHHEIEHVGKLTANVQEQMNCLMEQILQLRGLGEHYKKCRVEAEKKISKIAGPRLYYNDPNIIMEILEFVYIGTRYIATLDFMDLKDLVNVITSTKYMYDFYKTEGTYRFIILIHRPQNDVRSHRIIQIPRNKLCEHEIELEQLLYVPVTKKEGRTLIHLLTRTYQIKALRYLLQKYDKLNINVETTVDSWRPIHNALLMYGDKRGSESLVRLFVDHGVELTSNVVGRYGALCSTFSDSVLCENVMQFCDYLQRRYPGWNFYSENEEELMRGCDNAGVEKTPVDYKDVLSDVHIMSLLEMIYDFIQNGKEEITIGII